MFGAKSDGSDPLAILHHGRSTAEEGTAQSETNTPDGSVPIAAPMLGTIVSLSVEEGATVQKGQQILILEAMKMQHVVVSEVSGYVRSFAAGEGDTVLEGQSLAFVEEAAIEAGDARTKEELDLDTIRPYLAEVNERQA